MSAKAGKATEFFNRYGFWPEHDPQRAESLGWEFGEQPPPQTPDEGAMRLMQFVMFGIPLR